MMMESLGLRCGKSIPFTSRTTEIEDRSRPFNFHPSIHYHSFKNKPIRSCLFQNLDNQKLTTTATTSLSPFPSYQNHNKKISPDKLDEWIKDSVSEIVRNIGEAPFLVHVYSPTTITQPPKLEVEKEKAVEESWPAIQRRWREGCPIPDGVILVEQLDKEKRIQLEEEDEDEDERTGTRAWGVLIQGRGVDTAACYILKTCRVWSALGFCTHFCLLRAKCFGDSAELQLQNSWNGIYN